MITSIEQKDGYFDHDGLPTGRRDVPGLVVALVSAAAGYSGVELQRLSPASGEKALRPLYCACANVKRLPWSLRPLYSPEE